MPFRRLSGEGQHVNNNAVTLRVPARAQKTCALCRSVFHASVPLPLPKNNNPSAMRCAPCRRREKCSRCNKIKKKKHFKKESEPNRFYKTCAGCRAKHLLHPSLQQKRAQAEMQGGYMRINFVVYQLR